MNPNQPAAIGGLSPDAFSSLFQSINGLRNRRALAALLGCMVVGILVAGLFSLMATRLGFFVAFLGGLFLFVAAATGIHAAGVLLMDQARGAPLRSLPDAVVYGLLCIPKFIVLVLALALVAIAVFIALAIVYFICKIPVLGPILFVVVFPLSVVISGLTLCGLFLCMFLALPAIWEGATITRAIAQALAIARSRLVESILLLAVVGLLSGVIGFIVFSVLFTGLMPSIGLSASILGGDGLYSLMGMMRRGGGDFGEMGGGMGGGIGGGAGSAGYAIAAGIGAGLLWALAGSLLSLVYLLGLNLVYLRVTEGLDVGATEAALKARLDDAKRQAVDLGQKARDAAERARDQARQSAAAAQASAAAAAAAAVSRPATPVEPAAPPPTASPPDLTPGPAAPAAATAPTCPQCLATVGKDDLFCGICGFRLK